MGLSYTGSSCLLIAKVAGCRRLPEPPARMMPLRAGADAVEVFMVCVEPKVGSSQYLCEQTFHAKLPGGQVHPEGVLQLARIQT